MKASSGRGRLALATLLLLLVVAGVVAWQFTHSQPGPSVQGSETDNQSGRAKVAAMTSAVAAAQRTGRPQQVSETFTDAELSSLANDQAQARSLPVDQIALHATGQGVIDGRARASAGGQQVPVTFQLVPQVQNDTVGLQVRQISLASFPLPGPLADQVLEQVRQAVDVRPSLGGLHQLRVTTAEGSVTVTGVAQPG
ncbi:MAG TPA: hypothetical protein VIK45_12505 [Candidatus Dormibacteraeota bacterium]|jgi:hypothetical protein